MVWSLGPNEQQFIVIVGLVVAALGPVLIFIGQICTGVGQIIEIVGFLGEFLAPVFSAIGSGLSALWGLILANPVIAIVVGIIAVIALLWAKCEWFRDGVTNLINNIRDGFKNGWKNIKNIWTNAIDGIKNKFSSIIKDAKKWGSDFIDGFKQGILNRIKSLFSVVTSIPKKIRKLLHFSRPDEGPLRDYETWMPDMMDGLAKGIHDNAFKVEDEVKSLASKMNVNAYSKASVVQTLSANSSTVIHLNVVSELDGRQVSKAVSQNITRSANSRLAFKGA